MNSLQADEIKRRLVTRLLGRKILCFKEVESTNITSKKLAKRDVPEGTVVVAESQLLGRGRRGRKWFSPRGGIWFSVLLRPELKPSEVTLLTLMAGVAVAKAVTRHTGIETRLKWPNDVTVKGKKVCGVLAELFGTPMKYSVLVGVGVNANVKLEYFPPELQPKATSLREELNRDVDRSELIAFILEEMERLYIPLMKGEENQSLIISEWKKLTDTLNAKVRVTDEGQTIEGLAFDIDDKGALILKLEDGSTKKLYSGDISTI